MRIQILILAFKGLILYIGKESPYIFYTFNLLNTDNPLIQTLSMAPSVFVLYFSDHKQFSPNDTHTLS